MLAFVFSSLLLGASLSSASHNRPVARQAEASPVVSPTCVAGTTTFSCPNGYYSLDAGAPQSAWAIEEDRPMITCGDADNGYETMVFCYYMIDQDFLIYERQPNGTTSTDPANIWSGETCPTQAAATVACNPTSGSSYTCSDPILVYNCPTGYSPDGTYTAGGSLNAGQDLICISGSSSCYYYGDSGRVDTLSTGHSSDVSCSTQLSQTGTCTNSLRRRNGKPTSPSWLRSRQAVVKKGTSSTAVLERRRKALTMKH